MIPLKNADTAGRAGMVTRALVIVNLVCFAAQFLSGKYGETLVSIFGFIPVRFFNPTAFGYRWYEVALTLLTSQFLHGGMVHVVGNMLYLYVFGGEVERRLGGPLYAVFYLICGVLGSLSHAFLFPQSHVPSVGASGSIAGVLGAFLILNPTGKVITLFPLIVSWILAELPAVLFLPVWLGLQFMNGWFSLASTRNVQQVTGVAWWAHVGGFVFGALFSLILLLVRRMAGVSTPSASAARKAARAQAAPEEPLG